MPRNEKNSPEKRSSTKTESLLRLGRNINALGAVALGGLAILIPGPNIVLASWAGINAAQAGGFELLRQNSKKKPKKKDANNT